MAIQADHALGPSVHRGNYAYISGTGERVVYLLYEPSALRALLCYLRYLVVLYFHQECEGGGLITVIDQKNHRAHTDLRTKHTHSHRGGA
jgi:hypothetical protein